MKRDLAWRGAVVLACVVGFGAWAVAQDHPTAGQPSKEQSKEQMMAQYTALAEPGPEHRALEALAGTFVAAGTSYCDPSGQPQTFTGTQTSRMILGGRFLQSEYDGQMMDMPFQGIGLMGYDNVNKKYISLWADTMGTAWMTSEGSASGEGKVFTLTGSYDDPVLSKKVTMRQVTTIVDQDHHTFEMFGPNPDPAKEGAEMKMMEITYTRQR